MTWKFGLKSKNINIIVIKRVFHAFKKVAPVYEVFQCNSWLLMSLHVRGWGAKESNLKFVLFYPKMMGTHSKRVHANSRRPQVVHLCFFYIYIYFNFFFFQRLSINPNLEALFYLLNSPTTLGILTNIIL